MTHWHLRVLLLDCFATVLPLTLALAVSPLAVGDEATVLSQLQRSREQYTGVESWANRRTELREQFLKGAGLWPLPERPPVEEIVHSRREYGDYSVENVSLETLPGFYCTGNLYRPIGRKGLSPIILCPHGHFRPLGRFRENHQIRCAHFARMGATVFSYSMVGWQDSQQTTHDDPRVLALQTWNSLRAIDYLTSLERVDPSRVGITGASGGGTQTFFLSLIDDRVKVSAPLVIVYPWTAPDGCLCEGGLPIMQTAQTNAIELAAAVSPRPQLIISVGNDPTENFPQVGFPFIQHMYDLAGATDLVQNVHLADEKHDFGPSKRKLVYEFFAEHLPIEPNEFVPPDAPTAQAVLPEDLSKITIESPVQMQVFDTEHPLPGHAITGSDAIAAAFDRHLDELRSVTVETANALPINDSPLAEYAFKAAGDADEALLFTPTGFNSVGVPKVAPTTNRGTINITVLDSETGQPTPCRINVVGPDGNYYEPAASDLKEFSLTGVWPQSGWGNRQGKAPVRYLGRYFYSDGTDTVSVPEGVVRVEAWKGFEYRPTTLTLNVATNTERQIKIKIEKSASMAEHGYWSGDPHIHIQRRSEADESRIFDLMQAEDIHFGTILAYNEPAGPYAGFMNAMESPQFRHLGTASIAERDGYSILSGQEYRSGYYGHLNLFLLDELMMPGESFDANNWPPFGHVAASAKEAGGVAFYAHGGYAKEIYADVVQGNIDGVELLQFGVYRGIGLIDWYHMLNTGFRVPAVGACDYPACRKLGDCKTYVWSDETPDIVSWLRGRAHGESFMTSGPLLLLDVNGQRPGEQIVKSGDGLHAVTARVRVRSEVAPVTHVQFIVNGRIVHEMQVPASSGQGHWLELVQAIELEESAWVAARAYSLSPNGTPDAESHTNPVYVTIDDQAPYNQQSLDVLVNAIDKQITIHKERVFPERAKVIAYFEHSRDILMLIRQAGGVSATGHPSDIVAALGVIDDPGKREHTEAELKAFLKPQPPLSVDKVVSSFDTVDGFEMQLVAHEPMVYDPIAAAFDEDGNLYVCEMRDYPYKPQPGDDPIGTLRLLKDTDGDGTFDESHVFADKLLWAGGVACWQGGVFVAAAPDIWYLKDTDGDNRADIRRKVYTGFGTGNQQAMLNNLTWGFDHKIYGSTAGNGGEVRYVDNPNGFPEPISVTGSDFRFDPMTGEFETITGTIQFGNTFDDWGNRFLCSESRPLLHVVLPQRYLERNPYLPVPNAIQNLTGGPVPIFRISPLERWRMIRSSRRVAAGARSPNDAGASHHVIDAAAGVTVYRGDTYPPRFNGNIFIGGAQSNLVHRRILTADGVTFQSARADEGTEFVRSSDNWFRPVNFVNAPDGTLYVLDMSREILESIHVPDDVMKFIDLKSGRDHGRIYRLAPPEFSSPEPPHLSEATTEELVQALASQSGWWRETAHRLLYERQDASAVGSLREMWSHKSPQVCLHALWSLQGLNALTQDDLWLALANEHPAVLEHAMRLAEPSLDESSDLLDAVIELSHEDNPRVGMQAAFSLGESDDPRAAQALARLARSSTDDVWLRTAVLSSASELAAEMLITLLADHEFTASSSGNVFLSELAKVIGGRSRQAEIDQVLEALADDDAPQQFLLTALASGMQLSGRRLTTDEATLPKISNFLESVINAARETANDQSADEGARLQAIRFLAVTPFGEARDILTSLLDVTESEPVQLAAVRSLATYPDAAVASILLDGWGSHTPQVRKHVLDVLLARPARTSRFLESVTRGDASVAQLDLTQRAMLLKSEDDEVRRLATELLGDTVPASRAAVMEEYEVALTLTADASRGERVFREQCATCHRLGKVGYDLGPNLASTAARDAKVLLTHILAPNQYVLPNFENYVIVDADGRIYNGILTSQSATSVTLKREQDKTDTILRANIEVLKSTGKSMMPEGLEQKVDKQAMADLIAFLQANRSSSTDAPLAIGTLPGLIEPKPEDGP